VSDLPEMIRQISIIAIPVLLAITLHEAAHGFVANKLGDPTAKRLGRLTLNPIAHIDIFGTILIPIFLFVTTGFVIGYAKPVPVNFANLRNPKRDMVYVAGAGPGVNLLLALACGILFRALLYFFPAHTLSSSSPFGNGLTASIMVPILLMLIAGVKWNVLLALFNMFPIPPLDGGRVMVGLLPDRQSRFLSQLEPFGFLIVMFLVFLNPFGIMSLIFHPLLQGITIGILGIRI
jgi:Zn-dependent protease